MEQAHSVLRDTFGFDSFQLSQEAVIRRLLVEKKNALVLYPTGGGKSLTYQLPALCLDGLTLVISPLISLMKDQVDRLRELGVAANNLDSTLDLHQAIEVKNKVLDGSTKLLYVAPERLNNEGFVQMMRGVKISLLAVDESHCIAQWGANFRPDFLKIARFAEELGVERVLCLTATATRRDAADICRNFHIEPEGVFRTPYYRPNLAFKVEVASNLDEKINKILPLLESRTGSAMIYVSLQKQAHQVAEILLENGLESWAYHAGMSREQREHVQNSFMQSEKGIVCATIAFGMGIDKLNIRQVFHLFLPKTLESYSQEVGRAGRDGLPSECIMFLSGPDVSTLEGFAYGDTCSEENLHSWMEEVARAIPTSDGTIEFNPHKQPHTYDTWPTVLGILYAQLELDYGYIRAITPFHCNYELIGTSYDNWNAVKSDNSPIAQAIRQHWTPRTVTTTSVDMVAMQQLTQNNRSALARKIFDWEIGGELESVVNTADSPLTSWIISQRPDCYERITNQKCMITSEAARSFLTYSVPQRYLVLNPLPTDPEGIKNLASMMHQSMRKREDDAVQKIKKVIDFATDHKCLAVALASYFGDDDAVPGGACGICTFCLSGSAVEFRPIRDSVADPTQIRAILNACSIRDPRLLARMAFGITSPKLTTKRLTKHRLFGSMASVDFNVLLRAFENVCKKGKSQGDGAGSSLPQKRTYSEANSAGQPSGSNNSQSGGNDGIGGESSKRARVADDPE